VHRKRRLNMVFHRRVTTGMTGLVHAGQGGRGASLWMVGPAIPSGIQRCQTVILAHHTCRSREPGAIWDNPLAFGKL
jgi:hypothetical protein